MGKKVHKQLKKLTPEKEESKVGIYIQIFLTVVTIIFAISYLANKQFLPYLQTVFSLDMFVMAYNNYKVYKRNSFTLFYIVIGIFVLGIMITGLLGW